VITLLCLLFFNLWPSELGVPLWVLWLSLLGDLGLFIWGRKGDAV